MAATSARPAPAYRPTRDELPRLLLDRSSDYDPEANRTLGQRSGGAVSPRNGRRPNGEAASCPIITAFRRTNRHTGRADTERRWEKVAGSSKIEWTEATWNPVTGCDQVSPGCAHCYAKTFAERWRGVPAHPYEQGFDLKLWPERLEVPLRWRKPKTIFVNSMSDVFHEAIPDDYVVQIFETMRAAHWHTFQVLTKREERMLQLAGKLDLATERLDGRDHRESPLCAPRRRATRGACSREVHLRGAAAGPA